MEDTDLLIVFRSPCLGLTSYSYRQISLLAKMRTSELPKASSTFRLAGYGMNHFGAGSSLKSDDPIHINKYIVYRPDLYHRI